MQHEIDIGMRIRAARNKMGWSMDRLALEMEVSKTTISKWENNVMLPRGAKLRTLAGLLQISLDDLMHRTGRHGAAEAPPPPYLPPAQPSVVREHRASAVRDIFVGLDDDQQLAVIEMLRAMRKSVRS